MLLYLYSYTIFELNVLDFVFLCCCFFCLFTRLVFELIMQPSYPIWYEWHKLIRVKNLWRCINEDTYLMNTENSFLRISYRNYSWREHHSITVTYYYFRFWQTLIARQITFVQFPNCSAFKNSKVILKPKIAKAKHEMDCLLI